MALIYHELNIPLDTDSTFDYIVIKQGDAGSHKVRATLINNNSVFTIPTSNATYYFKFRKPDNTYVLVQATVSNNQIIADVTEEMLRVAGTGRGEFMIVQGSTELKTATFYFKIVQQTYTTDDVISSSDFATFASLLAGAGNAASNANAAAAAANTAAANAAAKADLIPDDYTALVQQVEDIQDELENLDVETDATLTEQGKPADAKATGDKIDELNGSLDDVKADSLKTNNFEIINLTDRTLKQYINTSGTTVQWDTPATGNALNGWAVLECKGGDKFTITGKGGNSSRLWAFASLDKNILSRSNPNVTAIETEITAPSIAAYLIINNELDTPCYIGAYVPTHIAKINNDITELINSQLDIQKYPKVNALLDRAHVPSCAWVRNNIYQATFVPIPTGGKASLTVIGNKSNETYIGFMTTDYVGKNTELVTTFSDGETGRITIGANQSVSIPIPSDCRYVYVLLSLREQNTAPTLSISGTVLKTDIDKLKIEDLERATEDLERATSEIYISETYASRSISLNSENHDIPQNRGILNAYKKALQLKKIPWTALAPIPSISSQTGIAAGNHEGVIYSSVKEYDKYVGYNVSLLTFMTAAHNPYSLLYTEDTNRNRSKSEYGISYHGTNCGSYFGIVCNVFVGYALGWKIPWNTGEWRYLFDKRKLAKAADQSAYGMRRGDIVWEPGHGNIIIDIIRDNDGNPVRIYWAESNGDFPRINAYTPSEVYNRNIKKNGILYYYPKNYENTVYNQSAFVSVGSEASLAQYVYNDDICTYAGDYACFNSADDVWINYTAGSYTQLELYKGETLISTVDIDVSAHKIKLTTSGYGKYKARLKNDNSYSDYTYFEIVDTSVSAIYNDNILTVDFSSANGRPEYAQLTYRNGKSRGVIELTEMDIYNSQFKINPFEVLNDQYPGETFSESVYIKVFFRGDYGVVPNAYLDTGIVN